MRKALSLVLIAVFLVSFFGGASVVPSAKAAVAQQVTYNLGTEPATIDPALSQGIPEANVILQTMDGLTRINNKNVPVPAIAKSWTISKDRRTYTFTLRDAYVRPVCITKRERVGPPVLGDRPALRDCGNWHILVVDTRQPVHGLQDDVGFRNT